MKKPSQFVIVKAILVCAGIVSACGARQSQSPVLAGAQPTSTYTQNVPSETIEPTQTITPVPSITMTAPPQGVELDYSVRVSSYKTVSIAITLSNISSSTITLYRLASPTIDALPLISQMDVLNSNGNALNYKLETREGQADRHLQLLLISTGSDKKIIVTYTLNLLSQLYWKVTSKYIAVAENQIFFQPSADNIGVLKMQFEFSIPNNWNVVTRLTPEQDMYVTSIQDVFRVVTPSGDQRFFLGAPLVLGEFEVVETAFNNVRLLAAYPTGNASYASDASYVAKIFAIQEDAFGTPSKIDDYGILYVFGPEIPNGGPIPTIANHGTFETAHVKSDRHLGHEMYHMWWGCGNFIPEAWKFIHVPCWFMEGTNEYLSTNAHYQVGAFTLPMLNQWINSFYKDYNSLAGTPNDVPVNMCLDSISPGSTAWYKCLYSKSEQVVYLLDQTLNHLTNQEVGITDLINYLFDKYSSDLTKPITENEMQIAATSISGYDFKPFFDAYITGNELLPIKLINGQIEVDFEKLPELSKR